ncbi:inhibitor of apoptosis repeat-containing protein [Periconia macrospinosa]|uniref:Inhibitor of apoptosis repeat-containing protein n=1 Tax=Periconia macrospinosa TaxID=97972 RepID=A0A2V1DQE1_9PLEO|nr:inhibitor of apoptosis repeat-containing protein [Periconia macrospinosa]
MDASYASFQARLESFQPPKSKSRRTSSRSKKSAPKAAQKGGWPLAAPRPEDLAYGGFVFFPTSASPDNVQCFACGTQLDGWEEEDVPAYEHLTHSPNCGLAINICIRLRSGDPGRTEDDPLSEAMLDARRMTFADEWPLDVEAGFPSVQQMVDAGWYYDPSFDTPDGVTCAYCSLSLDAWDAGDDPTEEHFKRSPDCLFFSLKEFYHPAPKAKAARGKRSSTRSSTASKKTINTGRTKKGVPKEDLDKPLPLAPDDTAMSFGESVAESVMVPPSKPAARGRKTKKAALEESVLESVVNNSFAESTVSAASKAPAKRGRKTKKQLLEESMMEVEPVVQSFAESTLSTASKAPAKRGRKTKKQLLEESMMEVERQVEPAADSFTDSIASGPAKPAPRGRKLKTATAAKRTSVVSVASSRATRQKKRTSDAMDIDDVPAPPPKRNRVSDLSSTDFLESTPRQTPQRAAQGKFTSLKSPLGLSHYELSPAKTPRTFTQNESTTPATNQPATPTTPQDPPPVSGWEPINLEEFFENRDLFGIVSNVVVDAGLDKENINMTDAPPMLVESIKAGMTSPEKKMSIEQWVLYNAKRGEEKLRTECERQISAFEAQGLRALAALDAY